MNNLNIYIPKPAAIASVEDLTHDVKLFTIDTIEKISHLPGQFFMVSILGAGEIPISITSSPTEPLMFCVRKVGLVTSAMHNLKAGDAIGLRGPYGNGFPLNIAKGRDVVIVTGGLGIAPLRPLILEFAEKKKDYKEVFLVFGSRSPRDIIYKNQCKIWEDCGVKTTVSVDCADAEWDGCTGLVTTHLDKINIDFSEAVSFICGPEIMIENSMKAVLELGIPADRIITTLEAHMKCGVGKCGHCYKGAKYICTDGPVFSYKEILQTNERFFKESSPDADPMWGY